MNPTIPITIQIAGRDYRIKTEAADEAIVRQRIEEINEKIQEFRKNFAGKDMQDYLSMTLLWFATEQKKGDNPAANSDLQAAIHDLEALLNAKK